MISQRSKVIISFRRPRLPKFGQNLGRADRLRCKVTKHRSKVGQFCQVLPISAEFASSLAELSPNLAKHARIWAKIAQSIRPSSALAEFHSISIELCPELVNLASSVVSPQLVEYGRCCQCRQRQPRNWSNLARLRPTSARSLPNSVRIRPQCAEDPTGAGLGLGQPSIGLQRI